MKKSNKNLVSGEGAVTATTGSKTQEKLMEMKKMILNQFHYLFNR